MRSLRLAAVLVVAATLPWLYSEGDGQAQVRAVACPSAQWLPSCHSRTAVRP